MTKDELAKVDFYRGNAVQGVLRRYEFTEQEKRIIQRAIITARKDKPNMFLIDKADALLKECAATREPKKEEVDPAQLSRAIARVNMAGYETKNSQNTSTEPDSLSYLRSMAQRSKVVIIVLIISIFAFKYHTSYHRIYYSFAEAQEACQKKGKMLPLTYQDFQDSNYTFHGSEPFWTADGNVMLPEIGKSFKAEDKNGYPFICVDRNGKERRSVDF